MNWEKTAEGLKDGAFLLGGVATALPLPYQMYAFKAAGVLGALSAACSRLAGNPLPAPVIPQQTAVQTPNPPSQGV